MRDHRQQQWIQQLKYGILSGGILSAIIAINPTNCHAENILKFEGSSQKVISINPDKNTGLDNIYVAFNSREITSIEYPCKGNGAVRWHSYSNLGGGYAEEITEGITTSYGVSRLSKIKGNTGYIIEDGDNRYYFWLVDYATNLLHLDSSAPASEQECDATLLNVTGDGAPIHYYTINGQQRTLSREISVNYYTLEWNSDNKSYIQTEASKVFESLTSAPLRITPPAYCSTTFTVTGDRFLKEWGMQQEVESEVFQPNAVEVHTEAIQVGAEDETRARRKRAAAEGTSGDPTGNTNGDVNGDSTGEGGSEENEKLSNIIKGDLSGLGGSAPAEINFYAYVTDAVIHHEWQMSTDQEFETIDYRFNQQDLNYTFNEEGVFYLRYIGSNADGSCEAFSDTYEVSIGSSELLCPNAFTPDGDGVNDEWRVAYRSLIDFKCWIFDRYGTEIYYFDSPDGGWDGKRGNKTVKPGVYYYVIQATGADGKKYKKSGDINILRRTNNGDPSDPSGGMLQ